MPPGMPPVIIEFGAQDDLFQLDPNGPDGYRKT